MKYKVKTRDDHLQNDGYPKRILSLDGGGLRGILTIGILQKIESVLKERHGGRSDFRLCHYFDLIAGTSTGAIIAALLAQSWTVDEIHKKYMSLGHIVFQKSLLRQGFLRAKYDEDKLIEELKEVFGKNTLLRSDNLKTGLLIVTKRLDTSSPWPISNNPLGKYYNSRPGGTIGNGDYLLWQVVRASTAAPHFFEPQQITIAEKNNQTSTVGNFVDGGVSPYNNPALQALFYTTMEGYGISWSTGADNLQIISVGTGRADQIIKKRILAASHAIASLSSLMEDTAALQETILQWMSTSITARTIDRELGDLQDDLVGSSPLIDYLRYNVDLSKNAIQKLDPTLQSIETIENLTAMDAPENMEILHKLGLLAGEKNVMSDDFHSQFDMQI